MSIDQLTEEALHLPTEERVKLAQTLWASVDENALTADPDYEAEILQEAIERDRQLESGEVQPISHEEVMKRLRG